MGDSEFLQDVYAKHLPTDFGYPLRTPEPSSKLPESYQNEGLQIGDVGYVDRWGVFHVLFNIRYASNHDLHRKHPPPAGFKPIQQFDEEKVEITPDAIASGQTIGSRHIVNKPLELSDNRVLHRFVPSSPSGALLILPFGAIRHELNENERKEFRKVAVEHAQSWCAEAGRNSVYLITGFHKARSWSLGSFRDAPPECEILVKQLEPNEQDETLKIHEWAPNFSTMYWRAGPGGAQNKSLNQTVFITGFTITVRSWLCIPDIEPLQPSSSAWAAFIRLPMIFLLGILRMLWQHIFPKRDDTSPRVGHQPISLLSQPFHPSAAINHHLLDKNPNVRVAATHDRQWMNVLNMEDLTDDGIASEGYVWEVLNDKYISVSDNNAVWLERKSGDVNEGAPSPEVTSISSPSNGRTFVASSGDANKSWPEFNRFCLRTPSVDNPWIVISHIRADNIIAGLRHRPVRFYVLIEFKGIRKKTEVKSVPVCESVIEWDSLVILSDDPSIKVQFSLCAAFEFEQILGNGKILYTSDITVGGLFGSTSLINFSPKKDKSCLSLLVTTERQYCPYLKADSSYGDNILETEKSSSASYETDLGHDALLRYYEHYTEDDLKTAIRHFECALRFCPPDHECRPSALFNLATAKFHGCEARGIDTGIAEAIVHYREALDLRNAAHLDRPRTLLGLGQAILYSYQTQGNDESLTEDLEKLMGEVKRICTEDSHEHRAAILVLQTYKRIRADHYTLSEIDELILALGAAVRLPPDNHFDRPCRLENLGLALRRRFEIQGACGRLIDLDQAIENQEDAIRLVHEHCPHRASRISQLGESLGTRFDKLGNIADIEQAIVKEEEALQLTPEEHPNHAQRLQNLGVSLWARFSKLGDVKDIERAIAMQEEAVRRTPMDHPYRARRLQNLGVSLWARFRRLGDIKDIEQAISNEEEALQFTPQDRPHYSECLQNLGISLSARFDELGDIEDIERAIAVQEEAVKLTSEDHPHRAQRLQNLGVSLSARFDRLGDIKYIEQAIAKEEEAVQLTPEDHPRYAERLQNLGISLSTRFGELGAIEDIERAIAKEEQAIQLTPKDHPDRAQRLQNLGVSLWARFSKLGDIEDIERAIAMQEEAVKLTPEDDPHLAQCLGFLVEQTTALVTLNLAPSSL